MNLQANLNGYDPQNLNPMEADFSWFHHIPNDDNNDDADDMICTVPRG